MNIICVQWIMNNMQFKIPFLRLYIDTKKQIFWLKIISLDVKKTYTNTWDITSPQPETRNIINSVQGYSNNNNIVKNLNCYNNNNNNNIARVMYIIAYTRYTVTDIIIYNMIQCYSDLLHPSGRVYFITRLGVAS